LTRFSVVHDTRTRSHIVRDNSKKNRSSIHGRIPYSFFSTTNRSHYGKHAICVFVREQNRRRREQQRKHESRFIPFVNGNGRFSVLFFLFFSTFSNQFKSVNLHYSLTQPPDVVRTRAGSNNLKTNSMKLRTACTTI